MKDFWNKYKKGILIGIGGFLILIIIIVIIIILMSVLKKYNYQDLESLMVSATEKYIKNNTDILPSEENPSVTISYDTLVNGEYIKQISKVSKDASCQGEITIIYNEGNYYYLPTLECDNYTTTNIYESILNNEEIIEDELTTGLALKNDMYTYQGEYVNNYLSFANYSWRIVKFDEEKMYIILSDTLDKTTYVYDDRYNETIKSNRGYNSFENSRIYNSLITIYTNDLTSYHPYILTTDVCINQRSETDSDKTGDIECFITMESPIALLSTYDYMNASVDPLCNKTNSNNCANYNYLASASNKWWLLNGTTDNSYEVYSVNTKGALTLESANSKKYLRVVLVLPTNLIYKSGDGTSDNPYSVYLY